MEVGSNYSLAQIDTSFLAANLCGSFFDSKRNELIFDDGTIVELKSKQELLSEGITSIGNECFIDNTVHYYKSVWSIDPSGHLLKGFDTEMYPSEKEYLHINN